MCMGKRGGNYSFERSRQEAILENRVTRTRVLTDCSPTRLINAHLAFVSEKRHENRLTIDKRVDAHKKLTA